MNKLRIITKIEYLFYKNIESIYLFSHSVNNAFVIVIVILKPIAYIRKNGLTLKLRSFCLYLLISISLSIFPLSARDVP